MKRPPGTADRSAVVVVEDEPLMRGMPADIFTDAGYRVLEACNAADALTVIQYRGDIGTVFTDIEMPGDMNGGGLAFTICQRWPHIRVLVTCDRDFPEDRALPTGTGFIAKPYRHQQILARIKRSCHRGVRSKWLGNKRYFFVVSRSY